MTLKFERHDSFGKCHFYPKSVEAMAIVSLTGRKCLKLGELIGLSTAGFHLELNLWPHTDRSSVVHSPATESRIAIATREVLDEAK